MTLLALAVWYGGGKVYIACRIRHMAVITIVQEGSRIMGCCRGAAGGCEAITVGMAIGTLGPIIVPHIVATGIQIPWGQPIVAVMIGPGMTYLTDVLLMGRPVGKGTLTSGTGKLHQTLYMPPSGLIVITDILLDQLAIVGAIGQVLLLLMGIVAGDAAHLPGPILGPHHRRGV